MYFVGISNYTKLMWFTKATTTKQKKEKNKSKIQSITWSYV